MINKIKRRKFASKKQVTKVIKMYCKGITKKNNKT